MFTMFVLNIMEQLIVIYEISCTDSRSLVNSESESNCSRLFSKTRVSDIDRGQSLCETRAKIYFLAKY